MDKFGHSKLLSKWNDPPPPKKKPREFSPPLGKPRANPPSH